jgi:hypothetical protein
VKVTDPGHDPWPEIDTGRVDLETAKTLLAEAGKLLEAQQRGMESLRARLLDVARQATTLATATAAAAVAVRSSQRIGDVPFAFLAAAATAVVVWLAAAVYAARCMVPEK